MTIDIDRLPAALADDLDGAFPDAVQALQDGVFSGALRMTGDYQAAEDITQDAFVRAYEAMRRYPPDRIRDLRLRGWVWTIAANLCRNRARGRQRKPEALGVSVLEAADAGPGPEHLAIAGETAGALATAVASLPWAQRAAVVLHHVVGLTFDEAAHALGRPVGTVKSDVHRALARLRKEIGS